MCYLCFCNQIVVLILLFFFFFGEKTCQRNQPTSPHLDDSVGFLLYLKKPFHFLPWHLGTNSLYYFRMWSCCLLTPFVFGGNLSSIFFLPLIIPHSSAEETGQHSHFSGLFSIDDVKCQPLHFSLCLLLPLFGVSILGKQTQCG